MADAKLQIVIGALNRAQGDLAELKKQLGDLDATGKKADKTFKVFGLSLTDLKSGFDMVTRYGKIAVNTILDLADAGAQYARAAKTFELLTGGAQQAASMLGELKTATMNTRSELDLMNGAATLMSLGLARSATDVSTIMKTVEGLGARFGGTMQIFQLMMSNSSLMRIDSFGIGVAEATQRIDEFKAAGMGADEAFKTAVIELMGEKFSMLGGNIDDSATAVLAFKASVTDLKSEIGLLIEGPTGDFVRWLTELTNGTREQLQAQQAYQNEIGKTGSAFAGGALDVALWNEQQKEIARGLKTTVPTFDEYVESLGGMGAYAQELVRQQGYVAPAIYGSRDALVDYNRAMEQGAKSTNDYYIKSQKDMVEALAEVQTQYSDMVTAMDSGIGPAIEEYNQKQATLNEELATTQKELDGWQAKLDGFRPGTSQYAEAKTKVEELQGALGGLRDDMATLEAEHTRQTGQILMNFAQQMAAADGVITQEELDFVAALGAQYGLLDTAGAIALQSLKSNFDLVTQGGTDAALAVALLQTNIDLLHGKDVSVNVLYQLQDPPPGVGGGSASGSGGQAGSRNEMYAAGGVTGGGWARVGEQGPEMVSMPPGARVLSNPVTNNVTNNYNLSMHTRASTPSLRQDFALMRAMG